MALEIGVILALVAMLGWGFGDFFIQKSVRRLGTWEPLFLVTLVGVIVLTPFVYKDIPILLSFKNPAIYLLLLGSFILFMAAILDFKALKEGKLAIVEPIWSLEILVGAMLAFFIMHEQITFLQIIFIIALIAGLVLISVRSLKDFKHPHFEKAVLIAIISAIVMGSANFFIGWGARETNALVMNWFLNVFIAVPSLVVIILKGNLKNFWPSIKRNKGKLIGMCIFDNAAWIAFAQAMILAPIAIAVSLSESYIIVAVLLGIYVNREKLRIHQKIGLVLAIIAAVILATTI